MKKYIIIALVLVASTTINAQSLWNLTYDMSVPLGATKDFADKASFRGFGIDGRQFIDKNITIGGAWNWNVFYERREQQYYDVAENVTMHGDQFRTGNYMPFMFNSHYYFGEDGGFRPYIGTGVGTIWKEEIMQVGSVTIQNDNAWQFGLSPEIGLYLPIGNSGFMFWNVKYTYGIATGQLDATSYLNFGVGFGWENF